MDRARRFRELLTQPGPILSPGVYDCVSAKVAERAGFTAAAISGAATTASILGYPDVGLQTMTEVMNQVRNIARCVEIPITVDADTGYGNALNVMRATREFEATGLAGMMIEDQTFPKRCGHFEGKKVIPAEEMVIKIKAACDARRSDDFVIIGPENDPAGLKGSSVLEAIRKLGAGKAAFVSRGDNSGTNKKEIFLWKESGLAVPDKEKWYVQTGQGMIATINVATEKGGYTMTDRGTFIKFADNHGGNPPLKVLVEGDTALFNQYSIIAVNPANCKNAKYELARKFSDWMTSKKIQNLIGNFKLLNKKLYIPNAR